MDAGFCHVCWTLAGCGGSTQTTETAAAESGSEEGGSSAEGGKVLRYQASTLVDSLDPALSNDYTSSGVISQFMMGLMTKDESGAPVYGVAESEEKSEDGLTLTFKIRDDAKWIQRRSGNGKRFRLRMETSSRSGNCK